MIYFMLFDQMSSYDMNDPTERQQFQNMGVLWGQYQARDLIKSQQTGQADDVASILTAIIPLFIILSLCFTFKIVDQWIEKNFSIHIHLDGEIKREMLRFKLKEAKEIKSIQKNLNDDL